MTMTNRSTVVGVFPDRSHAEHAIDELHRLGISDSQIGFVLRGEKGPEGKATPETKQEEAGHGAAVGAAGGGVAGGILAAGASLLIPGVGPAIAGGVLAATLGGLAIGAAAGGITGALVNLGIPEKEAQHYQSQFEAGHPVVTVDAPNLREEVLQVFHRHNAYDIHTQAGLPYGSTPQAGPPPPTI